ncbi:hypothetical protein Scep_019896 [Stephania cephalantha]|uniref:Uncharacterized protein n=1 Tax=Stephania cephalantha TaxID=152367 RepID=A0AAP0IBV5_9MAGN
MRGGRRRRCGGYWWEARRWKSSTSGQSTGAAGGRRRRRRIDGDGDKRRRWEEAEKLGRPPTALELCLYFHTKDHDGVTFIDSRVDKIVTAIQRWTPSGSQRKHATAGGAGGGDGAESSWPISSSNEPVELLWRDFQTMQTHILRVMQDHTLTQDQLREVQGQLRRME